MPSFFRTLHKDTRQGLLPVADLVLTLYAPTPQNGQTHSNNSSAKAHK